MKCVCVDLYFLGAFYISVIYGIQQCGNCPSGYFVNGCKTNTTANCEQCPTDSYKLGTNSLTRCTPCSICRGRNNIEVQKCNGTHDRTCRCRHDYWYDTGALFCSQCSACKRGKGVVKKCALTSDTKCQRCIKGKTFSPVHSKTAPCLPCKICEKNEEKIADCTRRKDTECRPIPEKKKFQLKNKSNWPDKVKDEKTTALPTTKIVETSPTTIKVTKDVKRDVLTTSSSVSLEMKRQENSDSVDTLNIILYVIATCIGLAFIVVVAVVIVKHRRKSTHPDNTTNQVSAPSSVVIKEPPVKEPVMKPLMEGYSDKLLRDVTYTLIDELSRNLNPKGRWKTLAGKLNFSSKDIENFGLEPTNATEVLLSHWGQQRGSTLHHLHEVLKSLKWFVEADLVAKYL